MTIHAPRAETAHEKSPDDDADTTNTPYTQPFYRYYVLAVLTVVYVFNFVDRQLLVILQEPIKAELNLSDTQLGLLTSAVFQSPAGLTRETGEPSSPSR